MRRRITNAMSVKTVLFHVFSLVLLSLERTRSFCPNTAQPSSSSRQHSSSQQDISSNAPVRLRKRQWYDALYVSTSDDEQDSSDMDDDDDEDDSEYGKFEKESKMHRQEEEQGVPLSHLPDFLSDTHQDGHSSSSSAPTAPMPFMDETQRRIEEQQQQIDTLMKLVQQQQQQQPPQQQPPPPQQQQQQFNDLSETPTSTILPPMESDSSDTSPTTAVAPLKAMLFIDGTWLYYSIHERSELQCPIVRQYGRGWQQYYQFDWAGLIRVISEQLQLQLHAWNSSQNVEITRASVYTSCKKDTSKFSHRIKMFEEMKANNYDVFMMETVGPGEKCVDIQLAVEMLHYATVANAYDVAILLRYAHVLVCIVVVVVCVVMVICNAVLTQLLLYPLGTT